MRLSDLFVMVVEPSRMQQRVIKERLAAFGIESIRCCSFAQEALDQIREDTPDLIVSAFHLADMTGAEFLGTLRADAALSDVAFMLICSETRFRYLDPVKQAGATAVLPKPFSDEQLSTALKTTLHTLDPEDGLYQAEYDPELLNILVVDDSPTARRFIIKVLRGLGMTHFVEANDGQQALDIMADSYFDLVVTDYNMPHVNGRELTEQIRQHSAQSSVPIMMVTSEENQGRLAAVQQAGVSAICDKPFAYDTVKQMVDRLLVER